MRSERPRVEASAASITEISARTVSSSGFVECIVILPKSPAPWAVGCCGRAARCCASGTAPSGGEVRGHVVLEDVAVDRVLVRLLAGDHAALEEVHEHVVESLHAGPGA